MGREDESGPPRPADHRPGYDEADPYEDVDLSKYPAWWRRNVVEFRAFDMRPYRPPRFEDGSLMPDLVSRLETELGVTIELRAIDPRMGDDWSVYVDGEQVATVGRERIGDGYTRYRVTAAEFERLVRSGVSSSASATGDDR